MNSLFDYSRARSPGDGKWAQLRMVVLVHSILLINSCLGFAYDAKVRSRQFGTRAMELLVYRFYTDVVHLIDERWASSYAYRIWCY